MRKGSIVYLFRFPEKGFIRKLSYTDKGHQIYFPATCPGLDSW